MTKVYRPTLFGIRPPARPRRVRPRRAGSTSARRPFDRLARAHSARAPARDSATAPERANSRGREPHPRTRALMTTTWRFVGYSFNNLLNAAREVGQTHSRGRPRCGRAGGSEWCAVEVRAASTRRRGGLRFAAEPAVTPARKAGESPRRARVVAVRRAGRFVSAHRSARKHQHEDGHPCRRTTDWRRPRGWRVVDDRTARPRARDDPRGDHPEGKVERVSAVPGERKVDDAKMTQWRAKPERERK